jgi:hypothetical protein
MTEAGDDTTLTIRIDRTMLKELDALVATINAVIRGRKPDMTRSDVIRLVLRIGLEEVGRPPTLEEQLRWSKLGFVQ